MTDESNLHPLSEARTAKSLTSGFAAAIFPEPGPKEFRCSSIRTVDLKQEIKRFATVQPRQLAKTGVAKLKPLFALLKAYDA
jgi:hypothetical protein